MAVDSTDTEVKSGKDDDANLSAFVAKASARDRANLQKHLTACDAEPHPNHAKLFRQLVTKMAGLAPLPVRMIGSLTAQFYIADGKYRMQVFALEDKRDGTIIAYFPDVLAEAVKQKWLIKKGASFALAAAPDDVLVIEQMDEKHPLNPPEHIKHLTGWNRKAVKLTLQISAGTGAQAAVVEQLCELAAQQWV